MKKVAVLTCLLTMIAGTALAGTFPLGLRAGYTSEDGLKQMHVGAHTTVGELFPNVELNPSLEFGFGDDTTIITANGDLVYRFTELDTVTWSPYGGGSLSLNYFDWQHGSDTHLGLSALLGTRYALGTGHHLLGEIRIGILDTPDLKLTVGYSFF